METDLEKKLDVEVELLRKIGQGDRRSFDLFYDRFSSLLFSICYRVLNNQEAAEDALQDVFLQIWEKAPFYNPARGQPLGWAVTLTRHMAIDRLRSAQRRRRLQEDIQRESATFEQFDGGSSFDAVASVEMSKLVREAIIDLSDDQREAIVLAFFSSLTQMEIAGRLGLPLGTIKARIRRGMVKLRDVLSPHLKGEQGRTVPLGPGPVSP